MCACGLSGAMCRARAHSPAFVCVCVCDANCACRFDFVPTLCWLVSGLKSQDPFGPLLFLLLFFFCAHIKCSQMLRLRLAIIICSLSYPEDFAENVCLILLLRSVRLFTHMIGSPCLLLLAVVAVCRFFVAPLPSAYRRARPGLWLFVAQNETMTIMVTKWTAFHFHRRMSGPSTHRWMRRCLSHTHARSFVYKYN